MELERISHRAAKDVALFKAQCSAQVKAVNGKPIRNLKELVAEVDGTADAYLRLDLEYDQVHSSSCWLSPSCEGLAGCRALLPAILGSKQSTWRVTVVLASRLA